MKDTKETVLLKWKNVKRELPVSPTSRILVYSPIYPVGDTMRYRIINASFLEKCKEVTHWCMLVNPNNEY